VNAVLDIFRRQPFFYTLEPPPLGVNSIDEFLFDTRRGFCGHYASAFAALLRAAGIPPGSSPATTAHLQPIRGLLDPEPERRARLGRGLDRGAGMDALRSHLRGRSGPRRARFGGLAGIGRATGGTVAPTALLLSDARLQFDALRQLWRERILRFDQRSQERLLSSLGIPDPDGEKIAMVMGAGLALVFIWLTWQIRHEQRPDPKTRAPCLRQTLPQARAAGLARRPSEGAEDFARRVAIERPDLGARAGTLLRRYSRLRYGASRRPGAERWFIARVRAFKPRGYCPR